MYKVVIVEDDRIIRQSIIQSDWGKIHAEIVGEAPDGERGLSVIKATKPHLVVTDINMPFMDGITFAKKVREIDPAVRIIFLTGYDNFEYVHEAVLLKSDDYLLKPINHEMLLEKAATALLAWSEENEKQKQLSASLPYFQQKFLTKVLYNNDSNEQIDIQNELLQLGIYLGGPHFIVMDVRIEENIENLALYQSMSEWQIDGEIEVLAFQYNEVFLLVSVQSGDTDWVGRLKKEIESTLSRKYGDHFKVATSSIYTELQEIETGIIEAKSKMEYIRIQHNVNEIEGIDFSNNYNESIQQVKNYISILQFQNLHLEEVKRFVFSIVLYLCSMYNQTTKKKADRLNQFDIGQKVLQAHTVNEVVEVAEALIDKIEQSNQENVRIEKSESLIYQAIHYIEEHYTDSELSLVKIAEEIHVSSPYLSNLFKEKTGRNFTSYLLDLRMEKAKELLETTQMRVQQISEHIGYLNPHYFSSSFKRFTAMTPLEYRKRLNG